MSIDETWLSTWFVDNYVRKCTQSPAYNKLSPSLSWLFDDVRKSMSLQSAVSSLATWRHYRWLLDLEKMHVFDIAEHNIALFVYAGSLAAGSSVCWMTELGKVDPRYCLYFTAVAFLHVAYKSLRHGLTDEMIDVLATLCGRFISRRRHSASRWSISSSTSHTWPRLYRPKSTISDKRV